MQTLETSNGPIEATLTDNGNYIIKFAYDASHRFVPTAGSKEGIVLDVFEEYQEGVWSPLPSSFMYPTRWFMAINSALIDLREPRTTEAPAPAVSWRDRPAML